MVVTFYETTSENKTVNKFLRNSITLENVDIKEPCDILNPILILSNAEVLERNYFYIADLHRYYFITNAVLLNNGIIEVHGKVDVLMTYKNDLLQRTAFILRQENIYNVDFNDSMLPIRSDTNYKSYAFGEVLDNYNFYITTNGGVQ